MDYELLKYIIECCEFLPVRFRDEFLESIVFDDNLNKHTVRKNHEYFIENILNELNDDEFDSMFCNVR